MTQAATNQAIRPTWATHGRQRGLSPLECAGAALLFGSYLFEWTFRGYMDYQYLRTLNMRFIVPWYDVIPHIGAILWLAGWWAETRPAFIQHQGARRRQSLTRWGGSGLLLLIVTMVLLNRPRVDFLVRATVPPMLPSEQLRWPIARLQMMRASILLQIQADWQRATLRRLDRVQDLAIRLGLGRDALRAAFGHPYLPASVGRLQPEMYDLYDTVALARHSRARPADEPGDRPRGTVRAVRRGEGATARVASPGEAWPPPTKVHDESEADSVDPVGLIRDSSQYGVPSSNGSAPAARFSKRVKFLRKVSLTLPVGPLRFLAMINSAIPGWSLAS